MKTFWKRNKAKIQCIYSALVESEKFEAKRSEMKRKKKYFFSRVRAKRVRNGSRFASFRFEAKKFLKRNRRTLVHAMPGVTRSGQPIVETQQLRAGTS